jgi:tRNA(Arg) A34 adenosine deaminase TadA
MAAFDAREVPIGCVLYPAAAGAVPGPPRPLPLPLPLFRAHNRTNRDYDPTRHAEVVGVRAFLDAGGDPAALEGGTLYVTVEPCVMCAAALAAVRVRRVVFGAANPKFGGCGSVVGVHGGTHLAPGDPHAHTFDVVAGVRSAEAVTLLRRFYARANVRGESGGETRPRRRRRRSSSSSS